jgi:hypothetical protein
VEASEAYPGASLWTNFNASCRQAQTVRDRAMKEAARERDQVINSLPGWSDPVSDRIEPAVNARYETKASAAQAKYDKDCQHAEKELMKELGQLEARRLG